MSHISKRRSSYLALYRTGIGFFPWLRRSLVFSGDPAIFKQAGEP